MLADKFGNRISLCERDCSLQRRHQKLLEEAPSPALTDEIRRAMGVAAIKAVRATGYENAGTIEFLLDHDGRFYFMEMNTRVQVEHPVSELITGTDIIKEQLRIASGEPISCIDRAPFQPYGHAMEFRINAEDPEFDFRPCPGNITKFDMPGGPGVRIESYIHEGSRISPYYDSMVAKLIVWGSDREEAIAVVNVHYRSSKSRELRPPFLSIFKFWKTKHFLMVRFIPTLLKPKWGRTRCLRSLPMAWLSLQT